MTRFAHPGAGGADRFKMSPTMLPVEPRRLSVVLRLVCAAVLLILVAGACAADNANERAISATATNDDASRRTPATSATVESPDALTDPRAVDDGSATDSDPVVPLGAPFSFDATPAFLAHAAEQIDETKTFRFEFYQEASTGAALGETGSREMPLVTGVSAGDTTQMRLNLSAMLANIPLPGFESNSDFSMNIVNDAAVMYLNAPFFRAMLSPDGSAIPGFEWMSTVANGWGRVDLGSVATSDVLSEFGMSSVADATAMLSLLESVGEVRDGGVGSVRGETTQLMYATVDLADLTEALSERNAILDQSRETYASSEPVTIEVHIDAGGYVRRISYTLDTDSLSADGESAGAVMAGWMQLDLSEFGVPVDIRIPDDATDITNDLAGLAEPGR